MPKFQSLTELFWRNPSFFPSTKICWNQQFRGTQNIEHKGLKGSFSRYYERVFKNTAKFLRNTHTRKFRGIVSVKKLSSPAQAPETERPLFFQKTHGRNRKTTLHNQRMSYENPARWILAPL